MADDRNYINSNEVFPIIDMIRREMGRQGLYAGNGTDGSLITQLLPEPNVINIECLRELPSHPTLVTTVIYTYDNGSMEQLTLQRDDSLLVTGFLIEISSRSLVNEQLEEETDMAGFSTIQGTLIRENGLFKNLLLEYTKAV
ncbi:hypothetical protein [Paenibacillus massiliensis]|uniref:hypothetical protein n=1 Tax=Paenibacillus massiliensis TaxID=225917 RepID=UPI00037D5AAA|nr:hypothetical protein [Paenibacillus massiliensis]